jgi:hypothetical protein
MASGTNAIGVAVIDIEPGMVEGRPCPAGRRMAECACSWESRGNMGRAVCLLILRFVAAITIGGQVRVVVVHVTIRTRDIDVSARQGKGGVVVIKACRRPGRSAVANITLLRETSGSMVRVVRILIISQVAIHACRTGHAVIPLSMALAALQGRMESG